MGVRGAGPDQGGVLEVRCCSLVVPIPSRRLLRHVLLPLALRLGGRGGLTPPRPEPGTWGPSRDWGCDGGPSQSWGQAATAIGGCGSLAGRNFCPKPVPSVPL